MPILFGIDKARTLNEITTGFFVCLDFRGDTYS